VIPAKRAKHEAPAPPSGLPEPEPVVDGDDFSLRMMGIGGTGVVTVNQVLAMAALIDGRHVTGLDQTGLSQKGGPVTSDLRISSEPHESAGKASAAGVDLYLAFDLLGASSPANLLTADSERTVAVVSTHEVPTGKMVLDTEERFPELAAQLHLVEAATRKELNLYLDAQRLSELLFDDHMPANMLAVGAAWQRGALPLSLEAIKRAIGLNGAAVEKNLAAFAWGRACVADPDAVEALTREDEPQPPELTERQRELVDAAAADGEVHRLLEIRVPELAAYQDDAYAQRYAEKIGRVLAAEQERTPGRTEITEAVARNLFKLMAYKDEYEVARLHLDPVERARLAAEFGEGARIAYKLHPPVLRALGMKRKMTLGPWFNPAFRVLRRMKRLRGTRMDPFGLARVRRVERALPGAYRSVVERALAQLTEQNHATAVELCELPDVIRGYEEIKLRNVALFRTRAKPLVKRLRA
jgi:indolepyruvate ferredoxin oxidoreductase